MRYWPFDKIEEDLFYHTEQTPFSSPRQQFGMRDGYTKKASRSEPPKQDGCTNRHVAKAASSHINDWSAQKQHLELAKPFRARERVIGLVWNKQNLNQIRGPEGKKCQKRKMVRNQNIYQWGLDFLFKLLVLTIHFLLLGFEIFLSSSSFMCRDKFQL